MSEPSTLRLTPAEQEQLEAALDAPPQVIPEVAQLIKDVDAAR